MEAHPTNCPLCSSTKIRAFSAAPHDMPGSNLALPLKECLGCGLAWQFPRFRTAAESFKLNANKYEKQEKESYYDPEKRRAVAAMELDFVESFFDAPAELLDIGAGDGTFVAYAAGRGWKCVGIDPSARKSSSIPDSSSGAFHLVQGTLEDIDSNRKFDVITMWDVIEHLDDPEEVLRAAAQFLKDDGVLIVETGNFQSIDRIVAGRNWWAYAVDHRWYFSPPNVARLLSRAGLAHTAMGTKVLRPWWRGSRSYRTPSLASRLRQLLRNPFSLLRIAAQSKLIAKAERDWNRWAGLGIFVIAASRHQMRPPREGVELVHLC